MKVLLDTCVWGGVLDEVRSAGHDVEWTGESPTDPGDDAILYRALQESRILITLDKDFGEMAIVHQMPHCGIVRLVNFSARAQGAACLHILSQYGDELVAGAIVTVEPGRIRVRPAAPSQKPLDDERDDSGSGGITESE